MSSFKSEEQFAVSSCLGEFVDVCMVLEEDLDDDVDLLLRFILQGEDVEERSNGSFRIFVVVLEDEPELFVLTAVFNKQPVPFVSLLSLLDAASQSLMLLSELRSHFKRSFKRNF